MPSVGDKLIAADQPQSQQNAVASGSGSASSSSSSLPDTAAATQADIASLSCSSTSDPDDAVFPIPPLDSFPPTGTPEHPKLSGYDFWRSLGSPKYVVAPMVDQSELPWRILSRRYGADLVYSPMIHSGVWAKSKEPAKGKQKEKGSKARNNAFDLSHDEEGAKELHVTEGRTDTDRPLFVQFCGNDPEALVASALDVQDRCDAIDLNLGCPQGIAKRGHYGAFLQEDWPLIFTLINSLHLKLKIPVTAKMRVFDSIERTVAYARMLERAGAQIITCHGRTREMKGVMTGVADWEKIKAVKQAVKVPVFANGNMLYSADCQAALDATGADGVMSAEGNLYVPTLFAPRATEPSRTFPNAPRWSLPDCAALTDEYLDIVAGVKGRVTGTAVRAHLFKITRSALAIHPDLRPVLGQAKLNEDRQGEERVARFREFARQLEEKLKPDREKAEYLAPSPSDPPRNKPLPVKGIDRSLSTDDSDRPTFVPHWLAQPYFRPPPTQEVLEAARRKRENEAIELARHGSAQKKWEHEVRSRGRGKAGQDSGAAALRSKEDKRKAEEGNDGEKDSKKLKVGA